MHLEFPCRTVNCMTGQLLLFLMTKGQAGLNPLHVIVFATTGGDGQAAGGVFPAQRAVPTLFHHQVGQGLQRRQQDGRERRHSLQPGRSLRLGMRRRKSLPTLLKVRPCVKRQESISESKAYPPVLAYGLGYCCRDLKDWNLVG